MRKFILTIIIVTIHAMLPAQNYNTTIGIKLAPGIATIYHHPYSKENWSRFAMYGGIEIQQRVFKNILYIETGLSYIEKGVHLKTNTTDEHGNFLRVQNSTETHYFVSLPISLIGKYKGFYAGAGVNINYYVARRWVQNKELVTTELLRYIDNFTFAAQFSIGYELKLPKRFLVSFEAYAIPTFKARFLNYGIGVGLKYIICKPKE